MSSAPRYLAQRAVGSGHLRLAARGPVPGADYARLGEQIATAIDAGARRIHVDIMDGHFVPNLSFGPGTVSALAPIVHAVKGTVECRLMMTDPDRHLAGFARAGADARVLTRSAVLTAAGISACAWRSRPRDAIAGRLAGLRGESRAVG